MASRRGIIAQSAITTGTSVKTLLQLLAAANHAIRIVEIGISFHGTNNTHEPITVELLRQTTAGTMSAATLVKADGGNGDTLDTTGQHTATAEPTASDILRTWAVHPQTGMVYQLHDLADVIIAAAGRVGLRVTAANSVSADAYICFEE